MACRRIGQDRLNISNPHIRRDASLDQISALITRRRLTGRYDLLNTKASGDIGARHALCIPVPGVSRKSSLLCSNTTPRCVRCVPVSRGVRHPEAQLRPATDALARSGQGGSTGQANNNRLQSAAQRAAVGMTRSDCARRYVHRSCEKVDQSQFEQ
jgi:hypothetical protein